MLCRLFSSCGEQGLLFVPEHTGFRCWVSQSLEHRLSSYGTRAFSSTAGGIFLDQRSNPWPPAFAGGLVTTEPPGNPCHWLLEFSFIFHCSEPASPFQGGIHALHLIFKPSLLWLILLTLESPALGGFEVTRLPSLGICRTQSQSRDENGRWRNHCKSKFCLGN